MFSVWLFRSHNDIVNSNSNLFIWISIEIWNVLTWPKVDNKTFQRNESILVSSAKCEIFEIMNYNCNIFIFGWLPFFSFVWNYPVHRLQTNKFHIFIVIYLQFAHNISSNSIKLPFRVSNIIMRHKFDEPKVNKDINGQSCMDSIAFNIPNSNFECVLSAEYQSGITRLPFQWIFCTTTEIIIWQLERQCTRGMFNAFTTHHNQE